MSAPSYDPNDESYYEGTDNPVLLVTDRESTPDSNRLVGYVVRSVGFCLALVQESCHACCYIGVCTTVIARGRTSVCGEIPWV